MKTSNFKMEGLHCISCGMMIDGELEDLEGVESSKTNYVKSQTEVKYNPEVIEEKAILQKISKIGYKATLLL